MCSQEGQHGASGQAQIRQRAHLPVELLAEILDGVLMPLADPDHQPESFLEKYRLVGVDTARWSVPNVPAYASSSPPRLSSRPSAAGVKVRLLSAVELGTHAPLAAIAARAGESDETLARQLWARIPRHSLVIGDPVVSTPRTLWQALHAWLERDIAGLIRIRTNIKSRLEEPLPDGSARVQISTRDEHGARHSLQVREILAWRRGSGKKPLNLRLWTTLMDAERYPAETLARHYVQRWEAGPCYPKLDLDAQGPAHILETVVEEIAAMVLASAVVARLRVETGLRQAASSRPGRTHLANGAGQVKIEVVRIRW